MPLIVLDPRIIAAGFLDDEDVNSVYRLLGLLAYGRVCRYLELLARAEEAEALKQLGPANYKTLRRGPRLRHLLRMADERRSTLANLLPEMHPKDLVLASSVALHDEVRLEIDRADLWAHYRVPELGLSARRVVGSITGVLVDGLGEDDRLFRRRIDQEMLAVAAQADAVLVTQSDSLAPDDGETYERVAPQGRMPVEVCRLWTFVDRYVNRYPFDLARDVPRELLNVACRPIAQDPNEEAPAGGLAQ